MTVSPYASDAKISEALAAIGAELVGQTEQQLLQQLVVAAATGGGGGGGGATNALLLAGASSSNLAGLTAATAATGGLFYGTQSGADQKFTMTAAGATLVEAADAAAQKTALGLAAVQPFMLAIKNVTVRTTGTPADVATVTLPSWCTRYYCHHRFSNACGVCIRLFKCFSFYCSHRSRWWGRRCHIFSSRTRIHFCDSGSYGRSDKHCPVDCWHTVFTSNS